MNGSVSQALYGHTDTVTCVVASEGHSVIISGSEDRTCILWDLEELSYITQLPAHSSGVSALAINDLTVSLHTCSFLLALSALSEYSSGLADCWVAPCVLSD